jgi:hypothetical protein
LIDTEVQEIAGQEADTPYRKKCRANWARLIQKIYEIDPLTCPNCGGTMRVLAFIEEAAVIRKILDLNTNYDPAILGFKSLVFGTYLGGLA